MKIVSVIIAGHDPAARAAAESAAQMAFPSAHVVALPGLAAAAELVWSPRGEVLVLLSPTPDDFRKAVQLRNPRGLPRWPVVAFGDAPSPKAAQIVRSADWGSVVGARVLASAAALYELASENQRLCGDLRTLSRRFSHDMRAPLNCVSTTGEALGQGQSATGQSQTSLAHILLGAVTEIASLIDRVSFVLKASVDQPARQPLAMGNVVWAALQRLENRTRRQGAAIVQPEVWPQVEGVASWLEVIWENLIGNGLIHGGPTPRIELGWIRDSAEFTFRIRDHGLGVPPERRAQLFRPFDTLHELDAPRGLGLPIVQRLVELQGGRCLYESPGGGGACFIFTLPAAPNKPQDNADVA